MYLYVYLGQTILSVLIKQHPQHYHSSRWGCNLGYSSLVYFIAMNVGHKQGEGIAAMVSNTTATVNETSLNGSHKS